MYMPNQAIKSFAALTGTLRALYRNVGLHQIQESKLPHKNENIDDGYQDSRCPG